MTEKEWLHFFAQQDGKSSGSPVPSQSPTVNPTGTPEQSVTPDAVSGYFNSTKLHGFGMPERTLSSGLTDTQMPLPLGPLSIMTSEEEQHHGHSGVANHSVYQMRLL